MKREREGLSRGHLQEGCVLLRRGERDEVVLKSGSGLH